MRYLQLALCLAIATYTFNYGRWAWSRGLRRGAIGLWVLALASMGLPIYLLYFVLI